MAWNLRVGTLVRCAAGWLLVFCLASVCEAQDAGIPTSAWMDAYQRVQTMRHQEAAPLITGADADEESIARGIEILEDALAYLDEATVSDLANGSTYLRFRRFDVNRDLAGAYARLGDADRAVEHLRAAFATGVGPQLAMVLNGDELAGLREHEGFRRLQQEVAAWTRLGTHASVATPYAEDLSVEEKVAGLSMIWSRAREDFVYFDQVPDLDWDLAYREAIPRVIATESTRDYYRELQRFVALLRDGHSNAYPPEELYDAMTSRPPMLAERIEDAVIVREVRSASLRELGVEVGMRIVSIDGLPVDEYIDREVRPFVSSSTPQNEEVRCASYFLLSGAADTPVSLGLAAATGDRRTVSVSRSGYDDIESRDKNAFRELDGGFTYLALDHFESNETLQAFLASKSLIDASNGLVLDLRRNGGGNTSVGYAILAHLVDEPYLGSRTSHRMRDSLDTVRTGGTIEWITTPAKSYPPAANPYLGPVAVLISPMTFSAAEGFVVAFDAADRGALVGRTTGGSTGQPMMFPLPGGGRARVCVKRDLYPNGRAWVGHGIEPDIEAVPTIASVREGRDVELEAAVAWLRDQRK